MYFKVRLANEDDIKIIMKRWNIRESFFNHRRGGYSVLVVVDKTLDVVGWGCFTWREMYTELFLFQEKHVDDLLLRDLMDLASVYSFTHIVCYVHEYFRNMFTSHGFINSCDGYMKHESTSLLK